MVSPQQYLHTAAPVPRKKEGRAARLAAMMEKDGDLTPEEAAIAAAAAIEQEDLAAAANKRKGNLNPPTDENAAPPSDDLEPAHTSKIEPIENEDCIL